MCNSVGGANATTQALPASPPTTAPPAQVAGAAGGGGGCGGAATPTGFDSGGNVGALQDQLASGLRQLQAMGMNTAGGPPGKPGQVPPGLPGQTGTSAGGPNSSYAQVEVSQVTVPLVQSLDGASTIRNLQTILAVRQDRVARLEQALRADAQRNGGTVNPVDLQKFSFEKSLTADVGALIQKLTPLAGTMDPSESAAVLKLVTQANQNGSLDPVQLARTIIQIDGSASNLPASYLASANRGQDVAATVKARLDQLSNDAAATANRTGSFDPAQMQQVTALAEQAKDLQLALRRNLDLAKANPADAQARLDRALQAPDVAQFLLALG